MSKTVNDLNKNLEDSLDLASKYSKVGHTHSYAASSHNHTSLTGITSLTFAANSDDSSIIQITKDSATSYTDFIMSDDAGSDMWRWRFKAWDSSASATTAEFNLMTLKATSTTKGQLSVNGNITADSFTEGGTALSNKYAAASHGTHLTIGTGSGNAAAGNHTHTHLEVKGTNTVTSTTNDTTTNWGTQKTSIHWYTTAGQLTNQPSQWGYLLNIGKDSEVHQLWMTQASGDMLHRGGNASGWNGTWRTILDTSNFKTHVTPSAIGAATSSSVGTLSSLQTSAKDNLVAAINEVFQSGNNVKKQLVDTLVAKGVSCSTSNTWTELINSVGTSLNKANYSYTVSSISGAPYGFTLGSDGYYVSQGKGVNYTIAMCRINIVNTSNLIAYVDYIDYHHNDHNAIISKKDTAFNTTNKYGDDSNKILVDLQRDSATAYKTVKSVSLGTGSGFFDVKFCRGSVIQYDDVFKFRIRFSTI